jgi:hypothetical protein
MTNRSMGYNPQMESVRMTSSMTNQSERIWVGLYPMDSEKMNAIINMRKHLYHEQDNTNDH